MQKAAASAAGAQTYPAGALYVVATPIGNLADLTLRAIHVLGLVDAIACEDTRHSAPLLRQLGIEGKAMLAVHEHNERDAAAGVLARLARGERVAYVSDAGTPAISDPGAALVAAAQAAGYRCVPIPGASSAVAALSVAGDTIVGPFTFIGFLSSRAGERTRATNLRGVVATERGEGFAIVDGLLEFGVLFRGFAEGVERGESLRCRAFERSRDFERGGLLHGLAGDEACAPVADAEDVRSGHGTAFHEVAHGVEAFAFRMAQAGFGEPFQINVAPEESRGQRHDL